MFSLANVSCLGFRGVVLAVLYTRSFPRFGLTAFGRLPLRVLDFGGSVIPALVPFLRALLHWDGVTEKVTRL